MGANRKQAEMKRKAYFERRLKDRLSFLSKKGIESPKVAKDTIAKNLRANIEAINVRLKTIAGYENKTQELAKRKAEKAAAPQKDPEDSKPEDSKEKKEKKEKKAKEAPAEGKEKKKKKESAAS